MTTWLTVLFSLSLILPITGQDIAVFSGTKTSTTATVPNITAEALSRGPVLTVAGGSTFNSGNWETSDKLNPNSYIQWSVTADPGYIITIKEIQMNFDRDPDGLSHFFTGNGPAKIRLRTSLDNYTSDIYSNDKVSNSGLSPSIETALVSASGGTITFRLYGYAANIGMLGPLGTFDIEGGLGTILGLNNVGIRLAGSVTYDGLLYTNNQWIPKPPGTDTGNENVFIANGTYRATGSIQVKNLTVHPGAGIIIEKSGAITVNGNLITANNIQMQSDAENFSSLIVTDSVIGTMVYQRHLDINTPLKGSGNNFLVTAPLTGETFDRFLLSNPHIEGNKVKTLSFFGPFSKAKNAYATYSNSDTTPLSAGMGYRTAVTKNGKLVFTGMVNTKPVHKPLINAGITKPEWNLIGNPYPSYLDIRDFMVVNHSELSPFSSGLYSYDGDPSNGWTIMNLAYLSIYPNAKIPPGQGFFVASKIGGGHVSFIPEMQRTGAVKNFGFLKNQIGKHVGHLKLNLSTAITSYSTDFYFNDQSTTGLDPGYDAAIFGDEPPEFAIYSHLAKDNTGLAMAVQSLPYSSLFTKIAIPLGLNAKEGQYLKISIDQSILPETTEMYLEDMATNTFTLLNVDDYTFYTTSKLSGVGRFFLHFVNPVLAFGNTIADTPQIYTVNGGHALHIKGNLDANAEISILDFKDRLIHYTQPDKQTDNYRISLSSLKSGFYLVKLKSSTYDIIKKITID